MRLVGIIKISITLLMSFLVVMACTGVKIASIVLAIIALYAWMGEYLAILQTNAVKEDALDAFSREKINRIRAEVARRVKKHSGNDVSKVIISITPSNTINAMAYGANNISFTKGAIDTCDEMTLCAILAHEISHTLLLDAVFNRIIFADITIVIIGIIVLSFISISFIWLLFIFLAFLGICRGLISIFITSSISRGVKFFSGIFQKTVVVLYQLAMAAVSRNAEYKADLYSVRLGFGPQLSYYLTRFAPADGDGQKSLTELLYMSHPAPMQRLQKVNLLMNTNLPSK